MSDHGMHPFDGSDSDQPTRGVSHLVPGIELGEEIGHGGFATVYAGRQISVDRQVAVKIDQRRFGDQRNRRRFLREVTAVGRISGHPHVVSIIDSGSTTDQRPYLVMELCPNGSLADLLKRTGPLPAAEARRLGLAICSALAAAHEAYILHRDIKPANVLIDAWGTPRLADFGLAALPINGQELSVTLEALTPVYAAPEAFRNAPPSPRSDVWSMGATLHALISPFHSPRRSADGSPASIEQILHNLATPLPAPEAPGTAELMAVIEKATAYDPADRYADGRELYEALAALRLPDSDTPAPLVGGPEATVLVPRRAPTPGAVARPARAGRGLVAALSVGALALGAGIGGAGVWAATRDSDTTGASAPPSPTTDTTKTPGADQTGEESADTPTTDGPSADGPSAAATRPPGTAASFQAPAVGTCWGGLVKMNDIITGTVTTCEGDHAYETFAIGTLEQDIATPYLTHVIEDPNMQSTCTESAVREYTGKKNIDQYTFEVMPPRELQFAQGDRGFSCLLTLKEGDFKHKKDPA